MADLSKMSTDELIALRNQMGQPSAGPDLSGHSTEELLKMRRQLDEPDPVMDLVKSMPDALVTGVAAIPGAIGDVPHLIDTFAAGAFGQTVGRVDNYLNGEGWAAKPLAQVQAEAEAAKDFLYENGGLPRIPEPWEVINTEKVKNWVKPITGEMHQPETTLGRYGHTIASMAPAAIAGGGSAWQRVGQAVIPGIASETAGELFPDQAWARALAGIVASGGTAMLQRRPPEQAVSAALGDIDPALLKQAARLRLEADRIGIKLSWPEAVQQVSGSATGLGDLQRVVENSSAGGPPMRKYYADRPAQISDAAQTQFDQIAPQPMIPERLGPRVQQASQAEMDAVQSGINQQTRPYYQAAEGQTLPHNHPVLQNPAFKQVLQEVRADPLIAPQLAHLPDNAIGVIDEVQKRLRDNRDALKAQNRGYAASLTDQARQRLINEAQGVSPDYAHARGEQVYLRQHYFDPLKHGPTGKMAELAELGAQTRALFPENPQAHSEAGTARAVRGIGRTDPEAAENLIRQHLETSFNEATQKLQTGENQFGGAKFAARISGNPQQRQNLAAALRALPNGSALWKGFSRFLDILEATGKRPAPNSMTAFNTQLQKDLERGTPIGDVATIAASPQKAFSYIKDSYARFRLGKGTRQLANLFTTGNLDEFQRLLKGGPNSPQVIASMVRLIAQANAAMYAPSAPPN